MWQMPQTSGGENRKGFCPPDQKGDEGKSERTGENYESKRITGV